VPRFPLTLLALALLSPACKGSGETEPAKPSPAQPEPAPADEGGADSDDAPAPAPIAFDEVVYRFQDASVPPPHHRSVTITLKQDSFLRVVDSYGDELERQEGTLDDAAFSTLVDAFAKASIQPLPDGVGVAGCTGGTSETVRLSHQGKEVFVGTIDHCGGGDTPDFRGDLGPFIEAVKAKAPSGPSPSPTPG
jgi:hypothetical protein